jgi:DNA-binding GntR family transcriptional regulator
MPKLDLVGRGPVLPYQRIVDDLREKITSGAMLAGEQLPSVSRLCEIHSVSRVTVLKALTILRDDGLIVTVPRWGSFVAER